MLDAALLLPISCTSMCLIYLLYSFLFASLSSPGINVGSPDAIREFFWTLYNFIYFLGTYLKPHVSDLYFLIIFSATSMKQRCP